MALTTPFEEQREQAPRLDIPPVILTAVEHPGIVKSIEKTLTSLGGEIKIAQALEKKKPLKLYLRPADVLCKPILAKLVESSNLVLKFTVPKMTGRKRKRGSDESFAFHGTQGVDAQKPKACKGTSELERKTAQDGSSRPNISFLPSKSTKALKQNLHDNPTQYRVQTVGSIEETHRFRALPDFQYEVRNPLTTSMKTTLLASKYETLKNFNIDTTSKAGTASHEIVPPLFMTKRQLPGSSSYRRNLAPLNYDMERHPEAQPPDRKQGGDRSQPPTPIVWNPSSNAPVPMQPPSTLWDEDTLSSAQHAVLEEVRQIFDHRPICTILYLRSRFPILNVLRMVLPYVAFSMRSGPWADTYAKYGIDPRSNAEYAKYQVLSFRVPPSKASESHPIPPRPPTPYSFDGSSIHPETRSFQICDVTDPLLQSTIHSELRKECETRTFGWYSIGDLCKLRIVLKIKINALLSGEPFDNADFEPILSVSSTDISTAGADLHSLVPASASPKAHEVITEFKRLVWRPIRALAVGEGNSVRESTDSSIPDELDNEAANGDEITNDNEAIDEPTPF